MGHRDIRVATREDQEEISTPRDLGVRTHLADEGQLQGDIQDDLGVAGRQLLGSVLGRGAVNQPSRVNNQCDEGLRYASPVLGTFSRAKCWRFCPAPPRRVPRGRRQMGRKAQGQPRPGW